MRTWVCHLEIIVGLELFGHYCWIVEIIVWCHVCFAALKIKETWEKNLKSLIDKVSGS